VTKKLANAVVVGGSMAGMAAARVLAEHFEQVTLVERDRLPAEPEQRRGVPQCLQAHLLLAEGRSVYEQLFPGLDDTLAAAGSPLVDVINDAHVRFGAGLLPRGPSAAKVRCVTRIRLEWEVRKRVAAIPNVRFLENADAVGLALSPDRTRVRGVNLQRSADGEGDVPSNVEAEVVVDASGRRSRGPEWLALLGYPSPEVTNVDAHVSYSTRLYEEIALPKGTRAIFSFAGVPHTPRFGAMFPVEGGRTLVYLAGFGKEQAAPTEDDAYLEFARSLLDPLVYEHLRHAKPLTKARGYRQGDNQWRDYAGLRRMPEGFVPIGDALCAFNPIYGQGMTVAALEAQALGEDLAKGLDGLSLRTQRRYKKIVAAAWLFSTGEDYRWPTTEGPPVSIQARIGHVYTDHVLDLAVRDAKIAARLVEVAHMTKPFSALLSPGIALSVLGRVLTGKRPAQWGTKEGPLPKAEPSPRVLSESRDARPD
jgi:2-polyprenyl-6-methoxyphenol hydroxylase-like FAD-dependent oxidoreductase